MCTLHKLIPKQLYSVVTASRDCFSLQFTCNLQSLQSFLLSAFLYWWLPWSTTILIMKTIGNLPQEILLCFIYIRANTICRHKGRCLSIKRFNITFRQMLWRLASGDKGEAFSLQSPTQPRFITSRAALLFYIMSHCFCIQTRRITRAAAE